MEGMIDKLQAGARDSAGAMKTGAGQAGNIVRLAERVTTTPLKAVEAVDRITKMSIQVASAAEQQSAVASEIGRNSTEISQKSEETSEGAKEKFSASDALAKIVTGLSTLVNQFKT
jgi:methyl-accepting chemotaxis protein